MEQIRPPLVYRKILSADSEAALIHRPKFPTMEWHEIDTNGTNITRHSSYKFQSDGARGPSVPYS